MRQKDKIDLNELGTTKMNLEEPELTLMDIKIPTSDILLCFVARNKKGIYTLYNIKDVQNI